jgi:beta-1,4-mannosyl-glycoprotein beta-1,4-N-acetylglucosaminyltransferase
MIAEGIKNCSPDDTILISDLDEIPNPNAIENYRGGVFKLEQKIHCFFLNYVNISKNCWYGTRIMKYNDILRNVTENYEYAYGEEFPEFLNRGCTPTKIRMITGFPMLKNGGWHFTYLGGIEGIKTKIMAFSHQEYNNEEFLQDDVINKKLKKGIDFFRPKNYRYIPVLITNKILPEYIVENQDKYTALIYRDVRLFRNVLVLISFKGYSFALRVYRSIRHIMKFER